MRISLEVLGRGAYDQTQVVSANAARAEGFSSTILLAMHSGIELYRANRWRGLGPPAD